MEKIKRRKITAHTERFIIIGMIVSDLFMLKLSHFIELSFLKTPFSKTIAKWCLDYYEKYQKAPHADITPIFEKYAEEADDPDLLELIREFLQSISNEYQREPLFNEQYAIDEAFQYLKKCKLKQLKEEIDTLQSEGKYKEAEELIENFRTIREPKITSMDILSDFHILKDELEKEEEKLYKFPGILGYELGYFHRGDLVSFVAPAKRGKTFWLIEAAIKMMMGGLRVVLFSFEMTRPQVLKRVFQNLTGEVIKDSPNDSSVEVSIPKFVELEKMDGKYTIEYSTSQKHGLTYKSCIKKAFAIRNQSKGGLQLVCHPMFSRTVKDISMDLDHLVNHYHYVPDVIIVDYADILNNSEFKADYRHQIDGIWKGLKGLAQDKHCLVVTASHSNKNTFSKDIGQGDVSEDVRKMNHVSVMIAINQKKQEKKIGVSRLNVLVHRHKTVTHDDILCLQNLRIGKPYLGSMYAKDVVLPVMED